jgi:DNA-binding transcriptional MerR regulator
MGKAEKPDEEVTAQELARRCGESYETVNHWARMELLPCKRRGRRRLFAFEVCEKRCRRIRELQNEGLNLVAIRRML